MPKQPTAYDQFIKKIQEDPSKPSNPEKPVSAYEKFMDKIQDLSQKESTAIQFNDNEINNWLPFSSKGVVFNGNVDNWDLTPST